MKQRGKCTQNLPPLTASIELFDKVKAFCLEAGLISSIQNGVIVALSGGADSVFLFFCALYFSKEYGFPLSAVHVNHGIRGEEADRDEAFCRDLCEKYGIALKVFSVDTPKAAEASGESLEQAARRLRYDAFSDVMRDTPACLLTAHTATDNLETVLFRMARGTGLRGLTGIPACRQRIVRPLLTLNAQDLRRALQADGVAYVEDSTNSDMEIARNYIRKQVLPAFLSVHGGAEQAVTRMCRQLDADERFLSGLATDFYKENKTASGKVLRSSMKNLDEALLFRVLTLMYYGAKGTSGAEAAHHHAAWRLLSSKKTEGRVDYPDSLSFIVTRRYAFFQKKEENSCLKKEKAPMYQVLSMGENKIEAADGVLYLVTKEDLPDLTRLQSEFTYTAKAKLPSTAVRGTLYVRFRQEGDAYRYGGINRKLKKLFRDKKLTADERARLPLVCDDEGILWVPGFGVRDAFSDKDEAGQNPSDLHAYFFSLGGKDE